jgi:Tfp pilus assembly protein PilE
VVVLIIGILASVAIPQYFRVVEKGRVAELGR